MKYMRKSAKQIVTLAFALVSVRRSPQKCVDVPLLGGQDRGRLFWFFRSCHDHSCLCLATAGRTSIQGASCKVAGSKMPWVSTMTQEGDSACLAADDNPTAGWQTAQNRLVAP